jgi:predicted RNase H-like nuclease
MRVIGIDLAWAEGNSAKAANETGLVALDPSGVVVDAGWAVGNQEVLEWVARLATPDTLLAVDAPLVVTNDQRQRLCERQVGQRYGRWKVSANSTNLRSPRLAGVRLLQSLQALHWKYDPGLAGPCTEGRWVCEVYPYTTLVGAQELGYDEQRPGYKRKPPHLRVADFRPQRAAVCDDLLQRMSRLQDADPPLDLASHSVTRQLFQKPSPTKDSEYKHREDLIDAALCAWTGALWLRHGPSRCQLLGADDEGTPRATIIAPARPEQRPVQTAPACLASPRRTALGLSCTQEGGTPGSAMVSLTPRL